MQEKNTVPGMILKIDSKKSSMSRAEALVCDYITKHPEEVIYLSVSELAKKSGVSDATVIRACQKIGSSSYQDLKITLARDIVTPIQAVNEEIEADDPPASVLDKVFQGILHTMDSTYKIQEPGLLDRTAVTLLHAGRICICGLGNSQAIAADLQHKLSRLGLDAFAYSDNHLQRISSAFLKSGDVIFCISHSGSSRDIVNAAQIAKGNLATVISLTNIGSSPLADVSDIALHTASSETRYRRVALSSRLAQMAVIDVIYTLIALKKEDSVEGFYKIEEALVDTKF